MTVNFTSHPNCKPLHNICKICFICDVIFRSIFLNILTSVAIESIQIMKTPVFASFLKNSKIWTISLHIKKFFISGSWILIFLVRYTKIRYGHLRIEHYLNRYWHRCPFLSVSTPGQTLQVRCPYLYVCCTVTDLYCVSINIMYVRLHIYIWSIFVHTDLSCRWRGDDDEMRTKKVCWVLDMDIIGTIPNLLINYEHIPGLETVSPVNVQIRTHVTDQRQSVI